MKIVHSLKILTKDIKIAQPIIKDFKAEYLLDDGLMASYCLPNYGLDRNLFNRLKNFHIPYLILIHYEDGSRLLHIYAFSENGEVITKYCHSQVFYETLIDGVQTHSTINWYKQDEYREVYKTKQLLKGDLNG